jgi:hypothetical protein
MVWKLLMCDSGGSNMNDFEDVVIAGIARNVGDKIVQSYNALSIAFSFFDNVKWLVIESDSTDNTIQQLEKIKTNDPSFEYITLGNLEEKLPKRTERIAYCRNKYLEMIYGTDKYSKSKFVAIADLDGVNDHITKQGVKSCWDIDEWEACTANQNGPYYDIWALKHDEWNPNDCWKQFKFMNRHIKSDWALILSVVGKMIEIDKEEAPIEVASAFGGLAVYKKEALIHGKYIGVDEMGEQICEHLSLNNNITKKGGRIFINPRLINCGINEHTDKYTKILDGMKRIKNG